MRRLPAAVAFSCAALLLALGAWWRWQQVPWHANVWGVDWLVYYELQARHLRHGWLPGWLLSWEGLHPPLSGVVHGVWMALERSFVEHWWGTVAASLGAPAVLGAQLRRSAGAPAGLLLLLWACLAPLQVNYGLNTSPYPWQLLLVAASTATLLRAMDRPTPESWAAAGVLSALAAQVHVLAFAAVLGQGLCLLLHGPAQLKRWGRPLGVWVGLVVASGLLVMGVSLGKTRDPWTFHITEEGQSWWRTVFQVLGNRFGPLVERGLFHGVLGLGWLLALGLPGRRVALLLAAQLLGFGAALALFYELHVADPRLSHYYLVPQLLLFAGAAAGYGSAGRWLGSKAPALPAAVLAAAVLATAPWLVDTQRHLLGRRADAERAVAASAAEPVRAVFEGASQGDVVAYLWDHTFLNDEPESLDPVAARWPLGRQGRPCFDLQAPRHHCHQHDGARFFYAPTAFTDVTDGLDEELRLLVNAARAPGRLTVVLLPGPEAPTRPWPAEDWMREHGGEAEGPLPGGVWIWRFPPGLHVVEVPMNPG